MDKRKNKKGTPTSAKVTYRITPFAKIAGIVKIKEDISGYFVKKENGYRCVTGTCL